MQLRVDRASLRLIRRTQDGNLLGIIHADGRVRIIASDRWRRPDHRAWVAADGIRNAFRGFSLAVRDGSVKALFPLSSLNPSEESRLEAEHATELERLLPLAPDYVRLE